MKLRPLLVCVVLLTLARGLTCSAQTAAPPPPPAAKVIITHFDSLERMPAGYEEETLGAFADALHADASLTGHVIVYDGRRGCEGAPLKLAERIRQSLVERRSVARTRVELKDGGELDKPLVLLQAQPAGATPSYLAPLRAGEAQRVKCEDTKRENKVGRYFNFFVCLIVVLLGCYWLHVLNRDGELRFLFRAYVCWWASWLAWLVVWTLKAFEPPLDVRTLNLISFVFTDVNAVLWILVYFNLTRGNRFRVSDSLATFMTIFLPLVIGYGALLLYFGRTSDMAYEIQESIELCVGFVAAMLVGWAFSLRYNTNVVFVVGYAYGFSQPIAFKAFFHEADDETSRKLFVVIFIVLGFLKLVWATVVTRYFLERPASTESLVNKSAPGAGLRSVLPRKWVAPLVVQTGALLLGFTLFLRLGMPSFLSDVMMAIGTLTVFITTVVGVVTWVRNFIKSNAPDSGPGDGDGGDEGKEVKAEGDKAEDDKIGEDKGGAAEGGRDRGGETRGDKV